MALEDKWSNIKPQQKKKQTTQKRQSQKKKISLNFFEVQSQLLKFLKTESEKRLLSNEEQRLMKILTNSHRNSTWVKSNIDLVLRILIEGELLKVYEGKNFIK